MITQHTLEKWPQNVVAVLTKPLQGEGLCLEALDLAKVVPAHLEPQARLEVCALLDRALAMFPLIRQSGEIGYDEVPSPAWVEGGVTMVRVHYRAWTSGACARLLQASQVEAQNIMAALQANAGKFRIHEGA